MHVKTGERNSFEKNQTTLERSGQSSMKVMDHPFKIATANYQDKTNINVSEVQKSTNLRSGFKKLEKSVSNVIELSTGASFKLSHLQKGLGSRILEDGIDMRSAQN